MRLVLTALLFVGGLIMIVMGLQFLVQPDVAGAGFGLQATQTQGLATIRADMTGFFVVTGAGMLWGAWRRAGDVLLVPAALLALALAGRIISLFADGAYEGFWLPMLFEGVFSALCIAGNRLLPHHKVEEIVG